MINERVGFFLSRAALWIFSTLLLVGAVSTSQAADNSPRGESAKVLEAFEQQASQIKIDRPSTIQKKHLTMFLLGVPLLILLLITGALGIAMGVYGKQVFVLHMISAGLTITLAFVHAIVGVIWFYPF